MHYFVTRRTYDATQHQFTENFAAKSRYVGVSAGPSGPFTRYQYNAADWAKRVVGQSDSGEVLIFVHGFNNTQNECVDRMLRIKSGLKTQNFNGAVIAFDWPSKTSYGVARGHAKRSAGFLILDCINALQAEKANVKIHIMSHSLGCYLTLRGFAQAGDPPAPLSLKGGVQQVLFVAPDVKQASLAKGTGYAMVMTKRCKRLTNYASHLDLVLDASGKNPWYYGLRAGQHGLLYHPPQTFADVSCADRYLAYYPKERDRTWTNSHNWQFDDSRFYSDAGYVIKGMANDQIPTRQPHSFGDQRLLP